MSKQMEHLDLRFSTRRISTRRCSTRCIEQLTASYAVVLADARPLVKLALVFSAIMLADARMWSFSQCSLLLLVYGAFSY